MGTIDSITAKRKMQKNIENNDIIYAIIFSECRLDFSFVSETGNCLDNKEFNCAYPNYYKPSFIFSHCSVYDPDYISFRESKSHAEYKGLEPFSKRPNPNNENFFIKKIKFILSHKTSRDEEIIAYFKEYTEKGIILTKYYIIKNEYKKYYIENIRKFRKDLGLDITKTGFAFELTNDKMNKVISQLKRNDLLTFIDKRINDTIAYFKAKPFKILKVSNIADYKVS